VVPTGGQNVTFRFNYATKEIRDSINNPPEPGHDGSIWWDGLGHDSRDPLYRTPFGAVTMGTAVRLRFRTTAGDATGVSVRVADQMGGGASSYRMTRVASVPDEKYQWGYDFYEVTLMAPDRLTVLLYNFIISDGEKVVYYADDAAQDGAWGQAYNDTPNTPYNIYVYDPAFTTPEWARNAVIYQIFPDRFRDGDPTNNPTAADWFYPAERGHAWPVAPWNTIVPDPEPNDPATNPWYMTYSSTFYGGDLQGVLDKLDYLQALGVNTIYFNPIFMSPSNHRYDGDDYRTIDPDLGDLALFQQLADALHARGMHLILDLVPNHTSSDSIFFDRFGRHPDIGACESVNSPYRSWFYFTPANPPGSGVCAGDTNYEGWFGVATLPKVNTTDVAAVRDYWMRAADATARYWLRQGADGYRVDVANEIAPSFFTEWRPILRAEDPEVVTYSETWNESDVRPMVLGDKFDSTMNYRFSVALLSFLRDTPFGDGDGNLNLTPLTPSEFERAMRAIQEDYPAPAWSVAMNLLDSHDTARFLWMAGEDESALRLAVLFQMTMPGAPCIYYGSEIGLTAEHEPASREAFPWHNESRWNMELLNFYHRAIALRHKYSALRTGQFLSLSAMDGVYAFARVLGNQEIIVIFNTDHTPATFDLTLTGNTSLQGLFRAVWNTGNYKLSRGALHGVTVPARDALILVHEGKG